MCSICQKVRPNLDETTTAAIFKEIGVAMAGGQSAAHFTVATDTLLGTTMEERDRETEALWEDRYRNGTD